MRYSVIVWNNDGQRGVVHETDALVNALAVAKNVRTRSNRTVKIGHIGDAIRHWTRTEGAHGNQWSARSTAECSR